MFVVLGDYNSSLFAALTSKVSLSLWQVRDILQIALSFCEHRTCVIHGCNIVWMSFLSHALIWSLPQCAAADHTETIPQSLQFGLSPHSHVIMGFKNKTVRTRYTCHRLMMSTVYHYCIIRITYLWAAVSFSPITNILYSVWLHGVPQLLKNKARITCYCGNWNIKYI